MPLLYYLHEPGYLHAMMNRSILFYSNRRAFNFSDASVPGAALSLCGAVSNPYKSYAPSATEEGWREPAYSVSLLLQVPKDASVPFSCFAACDLWLLLTFD
jgi:hypothetical protein